MNQLADHTAVVTGANQGLGRTVTEAYLKNGANVIMCARNEEMLVETYQDLRQFCQNPQQLSYIKADVSKVDQVEKLIDFAFTHHKRIDILVNNAGVYGPKGCIEEVDWGEWTQAIEVNLYGPMLMCRALLPHFKSNQHGKIINISGGGATAPLPRLSAYAAAKAAIVRLTETVAHETLGCGIDVNSVAPGALNTRMLDEILQAGPEKVGSDFYDRAVKQKEQGGASLERAASLCVFLASHESNGITGKLLSAVWDPWEDLPKYLSKLKCSEIYTLRRIVPADRGENWEKV
ncbi:MAG TPA: SDR family oxidoreductase [Planktothrix sp.]|jgi:3-oxoacyl-[acyl-carrier protein] reductase